MQKNDVRTYKFKVGKNTFIIVKINQSSLAKTPTGNALASNQANVKVFTKKKPKAVGW